MKIIAIIQARMESTRLPGKVLLNIQDKPVLEHIVERVSRSQLIQEIVIATSINEADDQIERFAQNRKIKYFRGSQNNVLERFYQCAKQYDPDIVVRLTGDNVLIDSKIIDQGISYFLSHPNLDYVYYREGLPIGCAVEIFTFAALEKSYYEASDSECLEHVTPYIYRNANLFQYERVKNKDIDYSDLRWTLDTVNDWKMVNAIYGTLYPVKRNFDFDDIIKEYNKHKDWLIINNDIEQVQVQYRGENE